MHGILVKLSTHHALANSMETKIKTVSLLLHKPKSLKRKAFEQHDITFSKVVPARVVT